MGQIIATLLPLDFRLWLGKRLYGSLDAHVVRVSRHRVIKGPCFPPEVEAMQYIRQKTMIPVPKIYATHTTQHHQIYIEMEYIQGEDLERAWRSLSQSQKKAIFADIEKYISILRELQPPAEDLVASALGNPAYDVRIGSRFFGPFHHDDFHSLIRRGGPMEHVARVLGEEVAKVHTTSYRTCFTHGDLVPRNIIVRNGRVAAIIDWGFAGWYPEYWEYTKGHYSFSPQADWLEHFRQAVPQYDAELKAEQVLDEMIPDPGTPSTLYRNGVERHKPGSRPSAAWQDARAGRQLKDLWSVSLAYFERTR
ncbi:kinase-like protein [Trichoderma austrokoningii]